jgi:hypothetical protein
MAPKERRGLFHDSGWFVGQREAILKRVSRRSVHFLQDRHLASVVENSFLGALWTGSPQWQIEGLRRLEIPEDMQKRFGFKPLGPADGPVKTAVFSGNSSRLYDYKAPARWSKMDRFTALREEYLQTGPRRTNLRYGYMAV